MKMQNLKKSTAKIAIFALSLGMFSVVSSTQASAHTAVVSGATQANISLATVQVNASLVVATRQDDITALIQSATAMAGTYAAARSLGLLSKDASSGTAQTATVRTSGVLSLYARTATIAAMSATGGTFSGGTVGNAGTTVTYNSGNTAVLFASTGTYTASGTPVAVLWTAPSTAGSYVVTLDVSGGTTDTNVTTTDPLVGNKAGEIEITVTNSINGTTVINNSRQLQNIASLDATTTATIEAAIANAPNTSQDIVVTGIASINTGIVTNLTVSGIATFQSDVKLGDNDKLYFGDGNDLSINHDGSNSYIKDEGTGSLYIQGTNGVYIRKSDGTENLAGFTADGTVELYYDSVKEFETTGYGATVYGVLQSQGLNSSGIATISVNSSSDALRITQTGAGNALVVEDSTNPDSTPFVVTAGGSVGVGTTNPISELEVLGTGTVASFRGTGGSSFIGIKDEDDGTVAFIGVDGGTVKIQTSGNSYSDKLVITSSGNVGINSTTPLTTLDVGGTASIKVPVGTTAERPGSPVRGFVRFNTDLNTFEGYNGTEWGGLGGAAEKDTAVSTTSATTCESFAVSTHRSATITAQIRMDRCVLVY